MSWISLEDYQRLTRRLYELPMPPATGIYPGRGKWDGSKVPKETPPDHPQHDITMSQVKKAGRAIARSAQPEPGPEEPEEKRKKQKSSFEAESFQYYLSW